MHNIKCIISTMFKCTVSDSKYNHITVLLSPSSISICVEPTMLIIQPEVRQYEPSWPSVSVYRNNSLIQDSHWWEMTVRCTPVSEMLTLKYMHLIIDETEFLVMWLVRISLHLSG